MINKEEPCKQIRMIFPLVDSIERTPGKGVDAPEKQTEPDRTVCHKAPEFVEHYRMADEDLPCDDGRMGGA